MNSENQKSEEPSTPNTIDAFMQTPIDMFMNAVWNPPDQVARMEITDLAIEIKRREQVDDPRTRIGPPIEPPWSFWLGLARSYLWMKHNGIKHWSERGRE